MRWCYSSSHTEVRRFSSAGYERGSRIAIEGSSDDCCVRFAAKRVAEFSATNIHYDVPEQTRAISCGGIRGAHLLVKRLGLPQVEGDLLIRVLFPPHRNPTLSGDDKVKNLTSRMDQETRRTSPASIFDILGSSIRTWKRPREAGSTRSTIRFHSREPVSPESSTSFPTRSRIGARHSWSMPGSRTSCTTSPRLSLSNTETAAPAATSGCYAEPQRQLAMKRNLLTMNKWNGLQASLEKPTRRSRSTPSSWTPKNTQPSTRPSRQESR